eukprot:158340_1
MAELNPSEQNGSTNTEVTEQKVIHDPVAAPVVDETQPTDNENDETNNPTDETEGKEQEKKEEPFLTSFSDDQLLYDRGYGCVIGAAIGDSIGSYCEFRRCAIDYRTVSKAMRMPGGGTWGQQVITGQVTDDTELAVSLAYGLMNIIGKSSQMTRGNQTNNANKKGDPKTSLLKAIKRIKLKKKPKKETSDKAEEEEKKQTESNLFDPHKIALEYQKWKRSYPFDMGFCTSATLSRAPDVIEMREAAEDYDSEKEKQYHKGGNLANGALMRCMPLCLYGYKLNEDNLYALMVEDASMTHHNKYVFLSNTCYAIMVQSLLTAEKDNEKRNQEAYDKMCAWLQTQCKIEKDGIGKIAQDMVDQWLKYVNTTLDNLQPAPVTMGLVKIAFQRCCYHLLKKSSYKEAIQSVVGEGGDTDTNACIVGGIMGAYHGLSGIPDEYIVNIHKCNPTFDLERDMFQAKWYFQDKIPTLLIDNAPSDEEFKCVSY